MKCSDRNQLENISSFIDFVALLIELHIWRNDIKYSSFQDASIDIKISPFEWSLEFHIKCAFSFVTYKKILFFCILTSSEPNYIGAAKTFFFKLSF
jgi:hypothetical protein